MMKKLRKAYVGLIMAFLYAPIVMLILYSFNNSKSRAKWGGFTLKWYRELFADEAIMAALGTTLSIGFLAALICTAIALLAYQLMTFAIGVFLGLTLWSRFGIFCLSALWTMVAIPVLYPIILSIGGGDTWKE